MRTIVFSLCFILINSFALWGEAESTSSLCYQVCFDGVMDEEILATIDAISELQSKTDRPPPTLFTLKKRAEEDSERIVEVMHAYGYYEAEVNIEYLGDIPNVLVRGEIDSGPQYCFEGIDVVDVECYLTFDDLEVRAGCPARTDAILNTEDQILEKLATYGYPLSSVDKRQVVVDQASKLVWVTFYVLRGPLSYFGGTDVTGLCKVRNRFIKKHVYWRPGELYDPSQVACTETSLQESGLFSLVTVKPADALDEEGYLPMYIHVEEVKYRHIGVGVSYSTDESVGAMAQWSHDNLTGMGDALKLNGEYSEIIKRGTLSYIMPDFRRMDQDLSLSAEARREDTPGYIEREISLLARITRRVNTCLSYSYAGRYEYLLSTKSDNNENYHLFSSPVQVRWDTSNRLLNPTRGTTIAYMPTPYVSAFNTHVSFLRQELFFATYQPLTPTGFLLFAFSGQLGSIVGQSTPVIPAPKRFYAGSSNGLRGYKYLSVSPLNGRKPLGGRSLMIFQFEPRVRIWNRLYLATFYDIGNVYNTPWPQLNKKLLRSTGVGFRYLTAVGPFRLDIAFPLDKRKGIDKSFQIYASIGQTF